MASTKESPRSRILCGLIVALLIGLGLASRMLAWLPAFLTNHAGDALWAAMIYWGFAFLFPRLSIPALVAAAIAFSFSIELSQLNSHPILEQARSHRLGALVLGHGFLWIDLIRYSVGVATAALADRLLIRHSGEPNQP